MTIECNTLEVFLDTIQGLVIRGLTLTANADKLTIELTGGY